MMSLISAEDLAKDIAGAELSVSRFKELKAEIDSRQEPLNKFNQIGKGLIENGHFLSEEVNLLPSFFFLLPIIFFYSITHKYGAMCQTSL